MDFGKGGAVGQVVLKRPKDVLTIVEPGPALVAFLDGTALVAVDLAGDHVASQHRSELQVLGQLHVGEGRAEQRLGVDDKGALQQVVHRAAGALGEGIVPVVGVGTIFVVDRQERKVFHHAARHLVAVVHVVFALVVITQRSADGEPILHLAVYRQSARVASQIRSFVEPVQVQIPQRQRIGALFAAPAKAQLVVLRQDALGGFFYPVGIIIRVAVGVENPGIGSFQRGVQLLVLALGPADRIKLLGVAPAQLFHRQVLLGVEHLRFVGSVGHRAQVHPIGDSALPGFALPGGDQDHAVGPARAVNGRRRSILEHLYRHNVVGVDVVDGVAALGLVGHRQLHAVHHVEGVVGGVDRAKAAHPHVGFAARAARVDVNLHPGNPALDGLVQGGYGALLKFFHVDGAHRAGQVGSFLGAVANHHDLFQGLHVFGQRQVDGASAVDRHFLAEVPDGGEHQDVVFVGYVDAVIALYIGDRAGGGALHQHVNAR